MAQAGRAEEKFDPTKVVAGNTYDGQGTAEDPFVVEFQKDDSENPMNWSPFRKWFITTIVTLSVFAVTFASSAYSESPNEIMEEFKISTEVFIVGVSLFVLGFAIGPMIWAPLYAPPSELYGRQVLWLVCHVAMVAFIGGSAGSQNITTLLVLRFFGGTFGGSPLVNSGGAIADLFPPAQRGLAMTCYCVAPFLGPVLGPFIGGFMSENVGWRWVQGLCAIMIGVIGIAGAIFVPETYAPVLLAKRAERLSRDNGKAYISIVEKSQGKKKPSEVFTRAIIRPWVLLFLEPIVLVASLYMAILYGILYIFMGAMPIVFNEGRGWSEGIGGLAFMGITIGIGCGIIYAILDNSLRYMKLFRAKTVTAESRLPPAIVGAIALPIGLFGFAWTDYPSIHWAVSIALSIPFGFGCVLVILPLVNYLIDSYVIYAASVLAAAAVFRCVIGAVFPLFTSYMYQNLGIHWATSVPAFLTLVCLPFPMVMHRYGSTLRMKCKYAFEAAEVLKKIQAQQVAVVVSEQEDSSSV